MVNLILDWNYEMAADNYKASIFMGWEYLFASKCLHKLNVTESDK